MLGDIKIYYHESCIDKQINTHARKDNMHASNPTPASSFFVTDVVLVKKQKSCNGHGDMVEHRADQSPLHSKRGAEEVR